MPYTAGRCTSRAMSIAAAAALVTSTFLVSAPVGSAVAADAIQLTNPDFEQPLASDGSIVGWPQAYGPAGAISLVGEGLSGSQGLRLVDTSRDVAVGARSSSFAVTPAMTYRASVSLNRSSGLPGVYIIFTDSSGARVGQKEAFFSTTERTWETVSLDAQAPQGATSAYVLLYSSSYEITTATWDSVAVQAVAPTTWQERVVADPINNVAVLAAGIGRTAKGDTLAYLPMNGTTGALAVVDVRTGDTLGVYELPGAEGSWGVTTTADGTAYIAGWPNGHLYRYIPGAAAVEDLGQPVPGQSFLWKLDVGPDGLVYGGTYPSGALFSYDPATGATRNYGQVQTGSSYVRDVAAGVGKVYAGLGSVHANVVEVDVATGERREIPLPTPYNEEGTVYDIDERDGRLFVRFEQTSTLLVHDLRSGTWVADLGKVKGLQVSEADVRGDVYFVATDGSLRAYNLRSGRARDTGRDVVGSTRGFGWANLDEEGYPESTLVMATYSGTLWQYNPHTGNSRYVNPGLEGLPVPLRSLAEGPDGRVYTSGYQSGGLAAFDPASGQLERFSKGTVGQVEGYARAAGKLFFGVYPGAHLFEFDPSASFDFGTNPKEVMALTDQAQDRAVAWATDGQTVAAGFIPTYGKLGGTVSLIDAATGQGRTVPVPVPDQSVAALEFVSGKVLGGTTVWGGLGIAPTQQDAKLFLLDQATGEVEWSGVPIPGERAITALRLAPDGTVWGVTAGKLFQFDPVTRTVLRTTTITSVNWASIGHMWTSGELAFGPDGTMYALVRGVLYRIDPATLTRETVATDVEHFIRTEAGTLYFIRDEHLVEVTP